MSIYPDCFSCIDAPVGAVADHMQKPRSLTTMIQILINSRTFQQKPSQPSTGSHHRSQTPGRHPLRTCLHESCAYDRRLHEHQNSSHHKPNTNGYHTDRSKPHPYVFCVGTSHFRTVHREIQADFDQFLQIEASQNVHALPRAAQALLPGEHLIVQYRRGLHKELLAQTRCISRLALLH